jgi:hypothetical protein
MTLKTGGVHRNVTMTRLAELTFIGNRDSLTTGIPRGVTVDALGETVFQPAHAIPDRVVPAMFEKIHMISAYQIGGRHATIHRGSL